MTNEIEPKDALQMIESGAAILIDVREPDEFHEMHIPYAISIPMSVVDQTFHHLKFPSDKTMIFHCKMGGRSSRVCQYVEGLDTIESDILNLKGGITAWEKEGLVVI